MFRRGWKGNLPRSLCRSCEHEIRVDEDPSDRSFSTDGFIIMTSLSFIMFDLRNVIVGSLIMQEAHGCWCAEGTVANRCDLEIAKDEVYHG